MSSNSWKSLALASALNLAPLTSSTNQQNTSLNNTQFRIEVKDDYTQKPVQEADVILLENEAPVFSTKTNQEGIANFTHYITNNPSLETPLLTNAFPNPASDYTKLTFKTTNQELKLSLHDLLGRELLKQQLKLSPGNYEVTTNLGSLAPGTYLLSVETNNQRNTSKIIKTPSQQSNSLEFLINQTSHTPTQQTNQTNQTLVTKSVNENNYAIITKREDYDAKRTDFYVQDLVYITKELSRNNELKIHALTKNNEEKTLNFQLNQEPRITPLETKVKSGYHEITQNNEDLIPVTLEIPSRDTTLTFKETQLQLLYPNQAPITNAKTRINNHTTTSNQEGQIQTHALNQEYTLQIKDERTHPIDTILNLWEKHELTLQELITIKQHELTLDLSQQPKLEIKIEELLNFGTKKDTAWITTTGNAEITNGNTIHPNNNKYSEVIPLTIHAIAENGTYKEFQTQITTKPITPRKTIILKESDTETTQPGYIILEDTIQAPTGIKEIHIPQGTKKIQTGLTHPTNKNLNWSYIRTTQIQNNKDTLTTYNVDFYLRDINNEITDSLNIHGLPLLPNPNEYHTGQPGRPSEHKMSPNRFAELMRYIHFEGRRNKAPPHNEPNDTIPQSEWYYLNTLNRWNASMNRATPDTIKIYKEVTNMERYSIPELYTSTMQEETLQTIIEQHHKWIEPLTGKIPLKIIETISDPVISQLNTVMILPDNRLYDWTGGWTGAVSVRSDIYGNVKSGSIILQTNPEISNMIGTVNHETYSTTILNAMTRTDLRTQEIATSRETIMYAASSSVTPTLYDLKMGRIIYQLAYETGEPIENILKLPSGYEYVPYANPNLIQYQKKEIDSPSPQKYLYTFEK